MNALMIHGAGGGGWEWNVWSRVFRAAGLAVSAPDLQPVASGLANTRLADYLAQMRSSVVALPSPRVLVGASLGGLLALANADIADALVLVNPLPPSPWSALLPVREKFPEVIPWRRDASLAGTRRALPDADEAACLFAFRHWRDESGAVIEEAIAGVAVAPPSCPVLMIASERDDEVPASASAVVAQAVSAEFLLLPGASHVGPLCGREAAAVASRAVAFLNNLVLRVGN